MPVCYPHNNPFSCPAREYKIIKYRPLPEIGFQKFGEKIVNETWKDLETCSPSDQAVTFETIM